MEFLSWNRLLTVKPGRDLRSACSEYAGDGLVDEPFASTRSVRSSIIVWFEGVVGIEPEHETSANRSAPGAHLERTL